LLPAVRAASSGHALDPGAPASVRLDLRPKDHLVGAQLRVLVVWPNPGLADAAAALVAEDEHAVVDLPERLPWFVDRRVLDLEQIGEVRSHHELDFGLNGLVVVVQDRQLLEDAVAALAPADRGRRGA